MTKIKLLRKEAKIIEKCQECKIKKSGQPVPGEGNPDAKVVFIGEAPGRQESQTGRPFVGRSGKFLTELLQSIGLKREDVFITSPVKYYPGPRTPSTKEIVHGMTHLQKQIDTINPKLIVLLGNVAAMGVLGKGYAVGKFHGQITRASKRDYFFTFHPSAARRFPKIRVLMFSDFKKLKKRFP